MTAKKAAAATINPAVKTTTARKSKLQAVPIDHEEDALAKLSPTAGNTVASATMIANLEAELTGAKAFIEENAAVVSSINAENLQLQDKLRAAELESKQDNDEILRVVGQMQDLTEHRDRLQAEVTNLQSLLTTARARIDTLEAFGNSLKAQRDNRDEQLRTKIAEAAVSTALISELGSELDAAEHRIGHLEQQLAHAQRGWIGRLFRRPVGGRT